METLFYSFGIALILFAFAVGILGSRSKELPKGPIFGATVAILIVLVAGTATFAVGFSNDEKNKRDEELNKEQALADTAAQGGEEGQPGDTTDVQGSDTADEVEVGPGGELALAASPTELAFDKKSLTSNPGEVTIDLDNPSTIPHNVAIEGPDGKVIDESETVASTTTSASATLGPGTYTFLCTVPGHAEAGMQGTLTVK